MVKQSNLAEINGLIAKRVKLQAEIRAHTNDFKKTKLLVGSKTIIEARITSLGVLLDQ